MQKLIKLIQKKVNGLIFSLVFAGVVMLMLAVLIVWSQLMLQLAVGLFVVVIAYMLFFAAYKIWSLKKEIEKHLKIRK
jgi:type IV secretory pathway VirB3-like protein